jgi:hypothetical protein
MKLMVVFAFCAAVACALPVEEVNQDEAEPILAIVDMEVDSLNSDDGDLARSKRQWGG